MTEKVVHCFPYTNKKNLSLDPATLPFEILKTPLHFYRNPAEAPKWLHDTNDLIKEADGFIFLSPEYNFTLSPALTNMVDHFPPSSFRHKPAGVVTYSMGNTFPNVNYRMFR